MACPRATSRRTVLAAFLALFALLTPAALGQNPAPGSREAMWPAPTAEDWAKPVLVTWQRSFEDAVLLAKQNRKPILICVNMDGEIASEHYAGIRYRDADIARLYDPYVCVIASVYRHTPRDYDEEGNRLPCPRFGTVTCGEHIAIEPGLYDKYFEGTRVAPRHIMIELDGAETYDVYYAFDTASVFAQIEAGISERTIQPLPDRGADLPLLERVASPDVRDRAAVEQAYRDGDRAQRLSLLRQALGSGDRVSVDLLRIAVFGFDVELARMAREALAQSSSPAAIDLILEALRVPMEEEERAALVAALERIGQTSDRARTLAVVHKGLARRSTAIDAEGWARGLQDHYEPAPAPEWTTLEARAASTAEASGVRVADPTTQLEMAEASLALAVDPATRSRLSADPGTSTQYTNLMFEDARRAALRAEELGAAAARVDTLLAIASYYLGDRPEAFRRAAAAVGSLPSGEEDWNAMAVLAIFAEGRREEIQQAIREKREWPGEWLSDVNDTFAVLARHPFGTDALVSAHYDFLLWMGAFGRASRVLDAGIARFPESWELHARLRGRLLARGGVEALEPAYEERLAAADASPNLPWYAGYASLVAAEYYRREGNDETAEASYGRAIGLYERAIAANDESRDSADHYVALALAGRARLALEHAELGRATDELLASFARRPRSAANLDGLGVSPVGTANMLRANLREAGEDALAARVQAALDELEALDPALLELPAFERGGTPSASLQNRGRRGR